MTGSRLTKPTLVNYSISGLFALILLAGCSKSAVYEKVYDKSLASKKVDCLKIESKNDIAAYIVKKDSFIKNFVKEECPVTLKITSHFVTSCTSAQAKALGSDFDGFLRLSLFRDGRLFYRNQRDFKGCLNQKVVKSLVDRMRERVNFEKRGNKAAKKES